MKKRRGRTIEVLSAIQWVTERQVEGVVETCGGEAEQHGCEEPLRVDSAHVIVQRYEEGLTRTT